MRDVFIALVASWFVGSCQIDTPNPVPPPGSTIPVARLSQLGIFQGQLATLTPAPGVVAYEVNASLYADRALKQRFMILPAGAELNAPTDGITGDNTDRWDVPVGTYFVKNFFFPRDARDPGKGIQLIETRFLVRQAQGYLSSTYLWNADQTDAVASGGNVDVPVQWTDATGIDHSDRFHVPGTSYCQECHGDRALGIRTRQMDLAGTYPDGSTNQLDHLVALGVLGARPTAGVTLSDPTGGAPLGERARSYLDANCSHCHAEQGGAADTHLYFDYEHTAPTELAVCRKVHTVEGRDRVIVPGHPEQSQFLARMESSDPFARMPLGSNRIPDDAGIPVLSEWVAGMAPMGCP